MTIEAWERFQNGEVEAGSVPDVIAESWYRSSERGVACDGLGIPHVEIDTGSAFIGTALPVLQSATDLLAGSETSLALADAAGAVVWRWESEMAITRGLDESDFEPGASLREADSGTSGIAVAATLGRPALVVGAQHYKAAWHRWACAAAPVFHPIRRGMVGVVNVACRAPDANHLLALAARSVARDVQAALHQAATIPEQRLLAAHLDRRRTGRAAISVDPSTLIIDDDGLRLTLCHADVWARVRESSIDAGEIELAPGVRARIHRLSRHHIDGGATLEIADPDGAEFERSGMSDGRSRSTLEHVEKIRSFIVSPLALQYSSYRCTKLHTSIVLLSVSSSLRNSIDASTVKRISVFGNTCSVWMVPGFSRT